jgi:para-aminobenzoate synthetase component 2
MARILVIDNYDSFVFNLVQYLQQLGAECTVVRNDEVQAIGEAFGATVSRAPELLHGKTSQVIHNGAGVLTNLPSPFTATRYHSLAVERDTVPAVLEITGSTESGVVMSMRHTTLPIEGVQFHPESVLTEHGHLMLANWLVKCGDVDAPKRAVGLSPVVGSSK